MINLYEYGNCESDLKGSGMPGCTSSTFGDLTGIALLKPGTKWVLASDSFDEATWKAKLKSFDVIPYLGLYNFEQNTPENERATSSTGRLSTVRNGKPQFSVSFDKGSCLHKSLYNKRGNGRWDIALVFEEGIVLAVNGAETSIGGFTSSLFDVDTYKLLQGSDPEMSNCVFQLSNAVQFNARHVFFKWSELGWDANDINGVIDTSLSYPSAPSAGTSISVKVTASCNADAIIESLTETTNWALGGTQASATAISAVAYNASTGAYDFTLDSALASADTVQPYLVSTGASVAENSLGELFKGQAPLATIS